MYAKEDERVRLCKTKHDNEQSMNYGTEENKSQSLQERNMTLNEKRQQWEKKEIKDIDLESQKKESGEIQKDGGERK